MQPIRTPTNGGTDQSDPDHLIREFVASADPATADQLLDRILIEAALPICRRIIYSRSMTGLEAQDAGDIEAGVTLHLLTKLRALRTDAAISIQNFSRYVTTTAVNACHARIRSKYPERAKLKNRLRYVLEKLPGFAVWEVDGGLVCGRAVWRGRTDVGHAPEDLGQQTGERLESVVERAFAQSGAPLSLDSLVDAAKDACGIQEPVTEDSHQWIADNAPPVDILLIQRAELSGLWNHIRELIPNQRAALLLNLRDSEGNGVIEALPATGTATIRELAAAASMPVEEFARIWRDLPWSDMQIAERLGVTRQQVINMRKAARFRLARRMRGNVSEVSDSTYLERG